MTLRTKFVLYWVVVHVAFAGAMYYFLRENRVWLLVVELSLVVSFFVAFRLLNHFFKPLEMVMKGADLIKDSNFNTSFNLTGQAEMDMIIGIYNRMLHNLQRERLRMQEKHFFLEKIIHASPSGIITLDYDENIAMVNPYVEQMLGIGSDNLTGKKLHDIQLPLCQTLAHMETGTSAVVTLPSRRKIRCTKSDFFDQGFSRTFFLLEELTEELRLSEKQAYEKLIRILSHEVNNSIGAANSLLHSCLTYKSQLSPRDQEDFQMAIDVVISRTEHLNAFMRSYVRVIRLADPKRQPMHVLSMLKNCATLFKADLSHRNIELQWQMDDHLDTTVYLDKEQMEQVLINVLKNAMEAIGNNGTITIQLAMKDRHLLLIIEDTGQGIPADVKGNLFTPFFSTKENGQGIGLTLIQEILTRHGFEFSLESLPGQPTRFSIHFISPRNR